LDFRGFCGQVKRTASRVRVFQAKSGSLRHQDDADQDNQ
jgi:hypothetical protein